ncbi:NAD(P)H-hydrate dehydratase [Spirochaetota bacterium]
MKVVRAEEMQEIDRITIDEMGIPGEVLMGFAGKSIADYVLRSFDGKDNIVVFSGTGNNGGDGFVIAYFLVNSGIDVTIVLAGKTDKVSETSRIYMELCGKCGIKIRELTGDTLKGLNIDSFDVAVDAIFGTGFKGSVKGIAGDLIKEINNSITIVVSVDMPSGLPSNGEAPEGEVVNADFTVTIGLPKISLVTYPGKKYAGEVLISDIGFPVSLTSSEDLKIDLVDDAYFNRGFTDEPDPDTHKGERGHLLLVGGFDGMEGAIMLSARAALETGVGLISLLTTGNARNIIAGKIPELITAGLDDVDDFLSSRKYDSAVIGPGMGRDKSAKDVFENIIGKLAGAGIKNALIDGDGLFHLAGFLKENKLPRDVKFIITPHFKEASVILDKKMEDIKNDRLKACRELAGYVDSIAVLKGPGTIISGGGKTLINTTGNPYLATAGSGDVLSGIIGSLMLRDYSVLDMAGLGVFIHGRAADLFVKENEGKAMRASDIINYIGRTLD